MKTSRAMLEAGQRWRRKNPEKYLAAQRARWAKNPEKHRAYQRQWAANNKQKRNSYKTKWMNADIGRRIAHSLRVRIRQALHGKGKVAKSEILLGCSIANFKIYLESKFEPSMNWQNYGKVWEIDHIIPCAIFDLSKSKHQHACFHFSNSNRYS